MGSVATFPRTKYPIAGPFPEGCWPGYPAVYRHGRYEWYATDGKTMVLGVYPTAEAADSDLAVHMAAKRRSRITAAKLLGAAFLWASALLCVLLRCASVK